jgi:hypothetical protein
MVNSIKKNIAFTATTSAMAWMVYANNFDYANVVFVIYTLFVIAGFVSALFMYSVSAIINNDALSVSWKSEDAKSFDKTVMAAIKLNKKFSGIGFLINSIKTSITVILMLLCGFEFLVVFYILTTLMVIHCVRVCANAATKHA